MEPLVRIHDNARLILRWLLITVPIAVAVGSIVALFLWLLDQATVTRGEHPWLLFLLPVAGLVIVFSYRAAGKDAEAGKRTYVGEVGIGRTRHLAEDLCRQAGEALSPLGEGAEKLRRLAALLPRRDR